MKKIGFILLAVSGLLGCEKSLSVEETAQRWVEFYYNSEFEKAKPLSTQITKNMMDTVAMELIGEEEILAFKITEMNCLVVGDSAVCSYFYKDRIEAVEEKVHLIRKEKKWLVDEPLADDVLTEQEMEDFFEDYKELLKEEMQQNTLENE